MPCPSPCEDWQQFSGYPVASSITHQNVTTLGLQWRVPLPETVEGSPLYVSRVETSGIVRDLVVVSTVNGRLTALNAASGEIVWSTTPAEGPRWTTSSPALDPDRKSLYVYELDGYVHKYSVNDGTEDLSANWPQLITLKGDVEKGSSALSIATTPAGDTFLYMTTAGYPDPGDAGDYQGHLVVMNVDTGVQRVFNAACSDKSIHFVENGDDATDCANVQSGIWARAGAVYHRTTNRLFITTGNGVYDGDHGGFNWGTSVIALRPDGSTDDGTPLDTYTPADHQTMTDNDLDLGSTAVAPLELANGSSVPPLAVQGGKDGKLRLLNLGDLSGSGGPRHLGGELQLLDLPQGGEVMTRPTTWLDRGESYVAVATDEGLSAFALRDTTDGPQLANVWTVTEGCTSPVYANGILFCAHSGELIARDARTGEELWSDSNIRSIHWQSPIIVGNRAFIADSDGLSAYALP